AEHWSRRRTHDSDTFGGWVQQSAQSRAARQSVLFIRGADDDVGERSKRRVIHQAPELDFFPVKLLVILLGRALDGVVIGIDGLDKDDTGRFSAPCTSRRLRKELKRSFGGAKIRQAQAQVGIDDPY